MTEILVFVEKCFSLDTATYLPDLPTECMQNHSRTPKPGFTLGLECLCHIYSHQHCFKGSPKVQKTAIFPDFFLETSSVR